MAEHIDNSGPGPGPSSRAASPARGAERPRPEGLLRVSEYGSPPVAGLRAAGGVDLRSYGVWERALRQTVSRGGELHLDLTDLSFIDARGTAMLVDTASRLTGGHRIVVHCAPPCLPRIMQVLWPDGVAGIEIEGGRDERHVRS